jgi:uncharacterized protein
MPRPKLNRHIEFTPKITYFKPQGVPLSNLKVTELSTEEIEAYRLRYINNLDQKQIAIKMKTSSSTCQRILCSANHKIAQALIKGQAIKIID